MRYGAAWGKIEEAGGRGNLPGSGQEEIWLWHPLQYVPRSGLRPVACCRDLGSDGIQASQLKRTFIWRTSTSVYLDENPAAFRYRAKEVNDVARKGNASPRFCGFPALFNRRFLVDPVHHLHLRDLFPGARCRNYQLRARGATKDGERGGGILRRRACRCLRRNLRSIVYRRGRLADDPVRIMGCRGIRSFDHLSQK